MFANPERIFLVSYNFFHHHILADVGHFVIFTRTPPLSSAAPNYGSAADVFIGRQRVVTANSLGFCFLRGTPCRADSAVQGAVA
eukprot:s1526_g8.t1